MKKISLTQGLHAIVDDDDFVWLSLRKWCAAKHPISGCFYAKRAGHNRRTIYMHVVVAKVSGVDVSNQVDHRNGKTLDNRKCNLRAATVIQNQRNRRKRKSSTSKYKGVSWYTKYKQWRVRIEVSGVCVFIGYFQSEKTAARAYDEAARRHFGEFARLNFEAL